MQRAILLLFLGGVGWSPRVAFHATPLAPVMARTTPNNCKNRRRVQGKIGRGDYEYARHVPSKWSRVRSWQ